MLFKEYKFREEFWELDPKARYLAAKVDYLLWIKFGKQVIMTCIFYEGGTGVHSKKCKRAFDIKTDDYLTIEEIQWIRSHINKNFPYDLKRPEKETCIYHKIDEKKIEEYKLENFVPEYHLHFQVWIK